MFLLLVGTWTRSFFHVCFFGHPCFVRSFDCFYFFRFRSVSIFSQFAVNRFGHFSRSCHRNRLQSVTVELGNPVVEDLFSDQGLLEGSWGFGWFGAVLAEIQLFFEHAFTFFACLGDISFFLVLNSLHHALYFFGRLLKRFLLKFFHPTRFLQTLIHREPKRLQTPDPSSPMIIQFLILLLNHSFITLSRRQRHLATHVIFFRPYSIVNCFVVHI